jgi:protein-disulfide isomerase-like protein with CxxC motif
MNKKTPKFHCSIHGACGQGIKNSHCEWCWPSQPITTIAQIKDILETEITLHKKTGMMGLAEQYQDILDYIK